MVMMMMVVVVIMVMMVGTDSIISSWVDINLMKQNNMKSDTNCIDQEESYYIACVCSCALIG